MTNLTQIQEQIKSEITVNEKGQGFASIRGTARLADVSHVALIKAFQGGNLDPSRLVAFLTSKGFKGGNLENSIEEGIPDLVVAAIVEYYAFEAGRYTTEQARLVYRTFASIGIRHWMREVAGWSDKSEVSKQQDVSIPTSTKESLQFLGELFCKSKIEPNLIIGMQVNLAQQAGIVSETEAEESRKLLAATTKSELLLAPSAIGKELGISARKVNRLLMEIGFQIKNPHKSSKSEPDYLPTEEGRKYSSNTIATGRLKDNTSYQHLKWNEQVVAILSEYSTDF